MLVDNELVSSDDIESLLEEQATLRKEGNHQRLGQMLVEKGLCSVEQLFEAIGYTAEAHDILQQICTSEERGHALASMVQKWNPSRNSLFQMALESGLVSFEELSNANVL